jgi:hypothetical protein
MSINNDVVNIFKYRKQPVLALLDTVTITNNNVINLYKVGPNYCIIKVKNNRMYRIVGPNLIEILVHNIPSHWVIIAVYKCLTDGNLKALYNSFIGNK